MADPKGQTTDTLIERLRGERCAGYDFFRLVRLIQAAHPECPPIGTSKTPQDDPIRFGQRPSLAFAPGAIDRLVSGHPPKLCVNFFGLLGPNGPLPLHVTQLAVRRKTGQTARSQEFTSDRSTGSFAEPVADGVGSHENHALRDFLDIFHHRLLSLFFRAWADCQPTLDLDRAGQERFLSFVSSICGGSAFEMAQGNAETNGVPARARAYYCGWLSAPARNAEGLESILRDDFGVATRIEEFAGRWFDVPKEDRLQLGSGPGLAVLGQNTIVGSRLWAVHLSFRVTMGPMCFDRFQRLLPCAVGFRRLRSWIADYLGAELLWDLRLLLEANEVPDTVLGRSGMLGWTTWLKRVGPALKAGELVLAGEHAVAGMT